MTRQNRPLTGQESIFAKAYAETGNAPFAAYKAGYAQPDKVGAQIAKRPAVDQEIRKRIAALAGQIAVKGLGQLDKMLDQDATTPLMRLKITEMAAKEFRQYTVQDGEKAPEDMTQAELQARMAHLRSVYSGLATDGIEAAEIVEENGDIFG